MSALSDQTQQEAILREVARTCWSKEHGGKDAPDNQRPTLEDLGTVTVPVEVFYEALEISTGAVGIEDLVAAASSTPGPPMPAGIVLYWIWLTVKVARPDLAPPTPGNIPGGYVEAIHRAWRELPEPRGRHPLAPLVANWQRRRVPVKAVTDYDRDLILSRQYATVKEDAEAYYLSRFKTAAHRVGGQLLLQGFEHPEMDGPTLPADVWNMQMDEAEKRGRGLPAALRIFLASVVHIPLSARASADPNTPPVMLMGADGRPWTLRHFLGLIYARAGGKLPRPNEYWSVLWHAREVLHAVEMPYKWNGRLWSRPLLRLDWPQSLTGGYETSMLDEPWPVSVHPPPGDGTGAPVNWHRLRHYMTSDAAGARALINLAYRWHIEGKRLMPAPGKAHWLQRRDPKLYDLITDRLAEQLCFPPGTGKARRSKRIADARAALERLVKAGDAVSVDGRLLPPPKGHE